MRLALHRSVNGKNPVPLDLVISSPILPLLQSRSLLIFQQGRQKLHDKIQDETARFVRSQNAHLG